MTTKMLSVPVTLSLTDVAGNSVQHEDPLFQRLPSDSSILSCSLALLCLIACKMLDEGFHNLDVSV